MCFPTGEVRGLLTEQQWNVLVDGLKSAQMQVTFDYPIIEIIYIIFILQYTFRIIISMISLFYFTSLMYMHKH